MPLWTERVEEGLLLREGQSVVLVRDDGGRWRLDLHPRHEALLGRRVRVRGVRSAFDLIDVRKISQC